MELALCEIKKYESLLNPIFSFLSNRILCMQRLVICETADSISLICDSKIIVSMNNVNFDCTYYDDIVKNDFQGLCSMIHNMCQSLDSIHYKIRQIVVHSPHQRWGFGIKSGKVTTSVEKVGERVVMLTCR